MEVKNEEIPEFISTSNKQAIELLTKKKLTESFALLRKAQELLQLVEPGHRLHAITYNNLGCFYKTVQKNQLALKMFEKSLGLNLFDTNLAAGTHLNLASIWTNLSNHKKSLDHGLSALKIFKTIYQKDETAANSLIFAAFTVGKAYEKINNEPHAEKMYRYGLEVSELANINSYTEKLIQALSSLRKKSADMIKPRYKSTMRYSDLPMITTNRSDYLKKAMTQADKRRISPKTAQPYSLILDIPFSKPHTSAAGSPNFKKTSTNINEIKKELLEYEAKFNKLIGAKKNLTVRPIKRAQNLGKVPVKPLNFNGKGLRSVSQPVDYGKMATVIQKHWKGFKARTAWRQERRKIAHQRAKEAIAELEILKLQAKKDELYAAEDLWRPKTYSPLKIVKSGKLYRTLAKFSSKSEYTFKVMSYAIKIQKWAKMWVQRKKYLKLKRSASLIARNVKRYQCMKLFQKIISAILFIQYQWRKILKGRKRLNNKC